MSDRHRGHRQRHNRGVKRDRRGETREVDENSLVIQAFRGYQNELDERYDKHERIVKLSRDITIESKRVIFLLQRISGSSDTDAILKEAEDKLVEIETTKFTQIAQELTGTDPHQFVRAYSPGLQEYIEAVSFWHYLKHKKLINLADVQARLVFSSKDQAPKEDSQASDTGQPTSTMEESKTESQSDKEDNSCESCMHQVTIPPVEYMLGIADLTGEVMRLAINSVGSGDLDLPFEIRTFIQEMQAGYVLLGNASREISRKLYTLNQSTRKVETACYTLQVRGSEIPKHMLADAFNDHLVSFNDEEINEGE